MKTMNTVLVKRLMDTHTHTNTQDDTLSSVIV